METRPFPSVLMAAFRHCGNVCGCKTSFHENVNAANFQPRAAVLISVTLPSGRVESASTAPNSQQFQRDCIRSSQPLYVGAIVCPIPFSTGGLP